MQWDYVYADLQLQVTFDADSDSPFFRLTDAEVKVLQQLLYHGLMIFLNVRSLYAADAADFAKRMDEARKRDNEYRGED